MKDLIVGFEFEGTRYGALIGFVKNGEYYIAECKELKSFSSPDVIERKERNRVLHGVDPIIIPLIQQHLVKELGL